MRYVRVLFFFLATFFICKRRESRSIFSWKAGKNFGNVRRFGAMILQLVRDRSKRNKLDTLFLL